MRKGVVLLSALLLVVLGIGIGAVWQGQAEISQAGAPTVTPTLPSVEPVSNISQLFRDIYARLNPSVVSIQVRIPNQGSTIRGGLQNPNQAYQLAAGSGFVFDKQGHIVTNAHVVQGADQIEVTFSDNTTMRAKVTGIDLDSDLAVIQVEGDASQYAPVVIGDSNAVQVGDLVLAIGNPFEETGTMTNGIVSALHRTVQGLNVGGSAYAIPDAIQTDAAINPGNSGGPLLNENGEVIGVNEQIEAPAGQSSGISFAISSNLVKQVVPVLIQSGKISHPYLGIGSLSLTLDINTALNLPDNTHGALITQIAPGSPAASAGLQAAQTTNSGGVSSGDVITAIDKQPIRNSDDLVTYLFTKTKVGQTITLAILRDGASRDITVKLIARPAR